MKKRLLSSAIMLALCCAMNAQTVQYGYTEEYQGANEKTPLGGVNINAGGATTKSSAAGKFKLEFKNLKVGDRVAVDVNSVVTLKNYVLFNKEAVEQWTVSGKNVYFRLVLCKKKTFDNLVMTYYNVSDKSLRAQLKKEREEAKRLQENGEIQQLEYEKLLKEADDRYQNALKHIRENAELVARIDESELEGNQAEILRLAKEGKLDEAVELIKKNNTIELFAKAVTKNEYATEQKEYYEQKEAEAREEIKQLASILKNNIKILQLAGGKENLNLCGEYWQKIIEADTTNLNNLWNGALYFYNQKNFALAEKYYLKTLAEYRPLYNDNPEVYAPDYSAILNNLGALYEAINQYKKAESYHLQAVEIRKSLAERNPDAYNSDYTTSLNNLGRLYNDINQYQKAESYYLLAVEIRKSMAERNPDVYNSDYASSLNNLGNLYFDINQYEKAELYYLQASELYKSLVEYNPDAYNNDYAMPLNNLGILYKNSKQHKKSESYLLQSVEIRKSLAEHNPDAYNPDYASSLNNLGNLYIDINQYEKAESYHLQALEIRKSLAERNPDAYNSEYAISLNNLGNMYCDRHHYDKAESYHWQALDIYKSLAERNPDAYNPDYAMSLYNLGSMYFNANQYEKAESYYLLASEIYKSLAEHNPDAYNLYYAMSLNNLGRLYENINQYEKAEPYLLQAVEIRKSLAERNPDVYYSGHVAALITLGNVLLITKQFSEAEKYSREAYTMLADIIKAHANMYIYYIAAANNLAISILLQGRYNEAEKIALQDRGITVQGKTLRDFILEDLKSLEEKGVIPEERKADVERLREVLK